MKQKEFGKEWQDEQREKMVRFQFPETIKRIEDKAREEGKEEGRKEVTSVVKMLLDLTARLER